MRLFLLILITLALTGRFAEAQLLDFDFSMDGNGGTITGEIVGLASSGASTPTEIIIYTQPAGYTYAPMALIANGYNFLPGDNTFTVSGGAITGANVGIYKYIGSSTSDAQGYGFNLNYAGINNANGIYQIIGTTVTDSFNTNGLAGVTYTPVPEPRKTMALFLLAGVGLLLVRKVRRRMTA